MCHILTNIHQNHSRTVEHLLRSLGPFFWMVDIINTSAACIFYDNCLPPVNQKYKATTPLLCSQVMTGKHGKDNPCIALYNLEPRAHLSCQCVTQSFISAHSVVTFILTRDHWTRKYVNISQDILHSQHPAFRWLFIWHFPLCLLVHWAVLMATYHRPEWAECIWDSLWPIMVHA